jgi:hypothetical protein
MRLRSLHNKEVLPRYGLKGCCCEIATYFYPPAFAHLAAAARFSRVHHCAIKVTKGVEEKNDYRQLLPTQMLYVSIRLPIYTSTSHSNSLSEGSGRSASKVYVYKRFLYR